MNVIELAKKVGLVTQTHGRDWIEAHEPDEELQEFAALIRAEALEEAASVCQLIISNPRSNQDDVETAEEIAFLIRGLK